MAGLDPLELACGIPLGLAQSVPALRIRGERASDSPAQGPLRALEEVCLRCLRRPPCLVSFSGGRDSSVVLAIATAVARREGLPDPIPATNRFGSVRESDETAWQELVVAHLRLRDWQRVELTTELDVVGRLAREVVAHHGVLPPFNGHFHAPLLALARGGSLLTGIGGDELFEPTHRAALARVLLGRRAPNRRLLRGAALAAMPRALRRRIARREPAFDRFTWLTDDALAHLRDRYAGFETAEPISYRRSLATWWWPSRLLQTNLAAKRLLARDFDAQIAHPLAAPEVLIAYGAARGALGPPGRRWALRELAGELLPAELIERETKSAFAAAFWTVTAREFANSWGGEGIDPAVVDADRLRQEWRREQPDPHTFLLIQSALPEAQPGRHLVGTGHPEHDKGDE